MIGGRGGEGAAAGGGEPAAVGLGAGVGEDGGEVAAPGGVVPGGHDAGEDDFVADVMDLGLGGVDAGLVVEDLAAKARVEQLVTVADVDAGDGVGGEFDQGIKQGVVGVDGVAETLHGGEEEAEQALGLDVLAPAGDGGGGVGQELGPVDEQQGLAVDADVAGVAEDRLQLGDEGEVVFRGVLLADEDVLFLAVPAAGPVFVGPAEAEGQVEAGVGEDLAQGPVEEAVAAKPVVVVAEAVEAVFVGEAHLLALHFDEAQVVKAEGAGQARLVVAEVLGVGLGDVGPFGEARTPPAVVLGDGVKLRQVKGEGAEGQVGGIKTGGVLGDLFRGRKRSGDGFHDFLAIIGRGKILRRGPGPIGEAPVNRRIDEERHGPAHQGDKGYPNQDGCRGKMPQQGRA